MFFDDYSVELKRTLDQIDRADIEKLEAYLVEARKNGKHVFVLGNGGSAAAASHWVCDFGKGINIGDSKRLKIFAPSDHTSIFTAYGNDNAYDQTMVEQLKNFLEEGDVVISLSVSGSSGNLVEAQNTPGRPAPKPSALSAITTVASLVCPTSPSFSTPRTTA